jgi:preprotein translocase SecE subunit
MAEPKKAAVAPEEAEELDESLEPADSQKGITAPKGRATPSRRAMDEAEDEPQGNFFTRTVRNLVEYFQGVRSEATKVTWPNRQETRRLGTVVVIVLILASIVLGIISGLFNDLFRIGLSNPIVLIIFMVGGGIALFFIGRYFNASQESRY